MSNEYPKTGNVVTVACKLPHGLVLEMKDSPPVAINGSLHASAVAHGYGITEGVPAEFFTAWAAKYKDATFIRKGMVFALPKTDDVKAKAKETKALKTGFERVNPEKPTFGVEPITKG